MARVEPTGAREWRRLLLTCAVLLPLLTVLQHVLLGYSWVEAGLAASAYTIGAGVGIWLRRIRPRHHLSR